MNKNINPIRLISLGAIVILLVGSLCSLFFEDSAIAVSYFPNPTIFIPIVNITTLLFSVVLFVFPKLELLKYFIIIPQIITTTMTGHETLGVFLFLILIFMINFEEFFSTNKKKILIGLSIIIFLILLPSVIPYGIVRFCMAFAETIFFLIIFYSGFIFFNQKFNTLLPIINAKLYFANEIQLPAVGESVNLQKIGLSNREALFLKLYVKENLSYGQIAQKTNTSLSIVKRDMSNCLTIFGCKNSATLKVILSNFILE